ncbi:ornithine cyclodeaminase family protein [bacterium]|nr:ornithine cyclodeaminase family protein [bacterium]
MIYLNDAQITALLSIDETITVVEASTRDFGTGKSTMPPKTYLDIPNQMGDFRAMPAFSERYNVAGVKWVNSHPDNSRLNLPTVRAQILLNDPTTAEPLALLDGTRITSMRTGAVGGIACKYLARKGATTLGILGAGIQAYFQAMAICAIIPITEIRIYDHSRDALTAFTTKVRQFYSKKLIECNSISTALDDMSIIATTTPSRSPIVDDGWIRPGSHINAIGADAPGKQELDPKILVRGKIVVDDVHQASHSGEINVPLQRQIISKSKVSTSLADILSGTKKGRTSSKQITIFDSTGLAIHDIATAGYVYRKAMELNIGTKIG